MFYIVGIGPGSKEYMINKAFDILNKCDYIIGFKRAVDSLSFIKNKKIYIKNLNELNKFIKKDGSYCDKNIAFAASGDPCFYGISNYVKCKAEVEFEIVPGISSFQYLTSKVKIPWNNAVLESLHGRDGDFLDKVKSSDTSIWLTDNENNPQKLCRMLVESGINCRVTIGENLSYADERIYIGKPEEFMSKEFEELNIIIIEKVKD